MTDTTRYDIITLGETMIRLTPPNMERIEQATSFDIHIGGSESNTAVGLARLGMRVAWISRLTDNPLGRLIAGMLTRYGVDTSHVVWTDQDRVATYFLEQAPAPRGSRVFYDRARSALSQMQPHELPSALFQPDGARLLHVTGITPGTGANAAQTTLEAVRLAKAAGWAVSFDLNYRGKLWSKAEARAGCEPMMQAADVLFIPLSDARTVYEVTGSADEIAADFRKRYPQAILVMTLGADGAMAMTPDGVTYRQVSFLTGEHIVGRVGGGDAFSAGFLYAWLNGDDLATALRWASAAAAIKHTIPGDLPLFERDEVLSLVNQTQVSGIQR